MRLIIAGSRTWYPSSQVFDVFVPPCTEVVSGLAHGADMAGKRWAEAKGIKTVGVPADWERLGKRAGPIRNRSMAEYADAAVIFWDAESSGSANMCAHMVSLNKPVTIVTKEIARNVLSSIPDYGPAVPVQVQASFWGLGHDWSRGR